MTAHVFGYGSLLVRGAGPKIPCRLRGYRRRWNVAMDNARDLPGYKYYVDPQTGARPAVMVTFLNIEEDPASEVNGVAFAVEALEALEALDGRERNYRRVDVRANVPGAGLVGPVWAYVGLAAARHRYEIGVAAGRAVISRGYHDGVVAGFESFGPEMLDEFRRTTEAPAVPLRELVRLAVDVPVDLGRGPRPAD